MGEKQPPQQKHKPVWRTGLAPYGRSAAPGAAGAASACSRACCRRRSSSHSSASAKCLCPVPDMVPCPVPVVVVIPRSCLCPCLGTTVLQPHLCGGGVWPGVRGKSRAHPAAAAEEPVAQRVGRRRQWDRLPPLPPPPPPPPTVLGECVPCLTRPPAQPPTTPSQDTTPATTVTPGASVPDTSHVAEGADSGASTWMGALFRKRRSPKRRKKCGLSTEDDLWGGDRERAADSVSESSLPTGSSSTAQRQGCDATEGTAASPSPDVPVAGGRRPSGRDDTLPPTPSTLLRWRHKAHESDTRKAFLRCVHVALAAARPVLWAEATRGAEAHARGLRGWRPLCSGGQTPAIRTQSRPGRPGRAPARLGLPVPV
ncbi:uncharacterized protein LOC126310129 [Schistocerca gregaria]|uniref:uncharacterized protein LOC126310129 n=1 Tax=Schistocerca gregaria TaxID=7010 RepID=UPI00211ECCEA|nr:uncharacterized protein LOC126310129 [Schistocerca gregaria]